MVATATPVDDKSTTTKTFHYNENLTWKNSPIISVDMAEATANGLQPVFNHVNYVQRREESIASNATLQASLYAHYAPQAWAAAKPPEELVEENEELERVREFKIKIKNSLSTLNAEIYGYWRDDELSTASIIQKVGLSTNQIYYRIQIISDFEKEEAIDFFPEAGNYSD